MQLLDHKMTKSEVLEGVEGVVYSKLEATHTVSYTLTSGERRVRYIHTDIIVFEACGAVQLNTGGFFTNTTRRRWEQFVLGLRVHTNKGRWWLHYSSQPGPGGTPGYCVPYHEGIRLYPTHRTQYNVPHGDTTKLEKAMGRMLKQAYHLPEPGDCFQCQTDSSDFNCLHRHVQEEYLHGSMIVNALLWNNWTDARINMMYLNLVSKGREGDAVKYVRQAVRRYPTYMVLMPLRHAPIGNV